jgi:hypothetical protein
VWAAVSLSSLLSFFTCVDSHVNEFQYGRFCLLKYSSRRSGNQTCMCVVGSSFTRIERSQDLCQLGTGVLETDPVPHGTCFQNVCRPLYSRSLSNQHASCLNIASTSTCSRCNAERPRLNAPPSNPNPHEVSGDYTCTSFGT